MTNKTTEHENDAAPGVQIEPVVMQAYEYEGIAIFREIEPRLSAYSDIQVCSMYRGWSNETACAGWLSVTDRGAVEFCKWAFTYPADSYSA